jgi:hypothetical protein
MSEPSEKRYAKFAKLLCDRFNNENNTQYVFAGKNDVINDDVDFYIKDGDKVIGIQHKFISINNINRYIADTDKFENHIERLEHLLNPNNLIISIYLKGIPMKKKETESLARKTIDFINNKNKNGIIYKTWNCDIGGKSQEIFNYISYISVNPSERKSAIIQCNHDGYCVAGTITDLAQRYLTEIIKCNSHYQNNQNILILETGPMMPNPNIMNELVRQMQSLKWKFKEIWMLNINCTECEKLYPRNN